MNIVITKPYSYFTGPWDTNPLPGGQAVFYEMDEPPRKTVDPGEIYYAKETPSAFVFMHEGFEISMPKEFAQKHQ